jgi:hypothetical protein
MENKETLELAAEKYQLNDKINHNIQYRSFRAGAKWQAERMYSDMEEYAKFSILCYIEKLPLIIAKDWFEQLKK